MLALLERNARKFGLSHDLGEDRVWEDRQELVGIERHRSTASDRSLSGRGGLFVEIFLEEKKTWQVRRVGRSQKRESGLQVQGSLLGRSGAVTGAGRVGCLLTTDKLRCFQW